MRGTQTVRGTLVATTAAMRVDDWNQVSHVNTGTGRISDRAVVRYHTGELAIRGGVNFWPVDSEGYPVLAQINGSHIHVVLPANFEPRIGFKMPHDRLVTSHVVAAVFLTTGTPEPHGSLLAAEHSL
jgi:hypothetical protein